MDGAEVAKFRPAHDTMIHAMRRPAREGRSSLGHQVPDAPLWSITRTAPQDWETVRDASGRPFLVPPNYPFMARWWRLTPGHRRFVKSFRVICRDGEFTWGVGGPFVTITTAIVFSVCAVFFAGQFTGALRKGVLLIGISPWILLVPVLMTKVFFGHRSVGSALKALRSSPAACPVCLQKLDHSGMDAQGRHHCTGCTAIWAFASMWEGAIPCSSCGYDLAGSPRAEGRSVICPECGAESKAGAAVWTSLGGNSTRNPDARSERATHSH
ncbi:MAG TPA: hypothetical protein VFF69_16670 [Phycisphaerales bacterium]|nr:hypothetical protein [Phycisphaerales bacterium]